MSETSTDEAKPVADSLENEGEIAADYLEELLEIADLDGDIDMDVEGDRATVSIVGAELPQLVGKDGEVLDALQELTRLAVYRETGERSRLMLDVSGHRADRRSELEVQAAGVIEQVKETGERRSLTPMTPFERKVVHDAVAAAGLTSESEGAEPRRYVVVLPVSQDEVREDQTELAVGPPETAAAAGGGDAADPTNAGAELPAGVPGVAGEGLDGAVGDGNESESDSE